MDRALYLAMNGASQALQSQQTNNHNLANAHTTGFRADLDHFTDRPVYGPGLPVRVYGQAAASGADMRAGTMMSTGRELDVAVQGEGWIAVQAEDGTEAYTRRGDLRLTSAGLLETGDGRLVMGNGGPLAIPPSEKVDIGADGTVTVRPVGQDANALVVVDRIKLVNPPSDALVKGDDGLFRPAQAEDGPLPADGGVRLASGMLESSNVNTVDALVQMISLARQFETQVKMMKQVDDNAAAAGRLARLRG